MKLIYKKLKEVKMLPKMSQREDLTKPTLEKVFNYDDNFSIYWNGNKMFYVQQNGKIINWYFHSETVTTTKKAKEIAYDLRKCSLVSKKHNHHYVFNP